MLYDFVIAPFEVSFHENGSLRDELSFAIDTLPFKFSNAFIYDKHN